MKEQIRTALLITTLAAGLAAHAAPVLIISDGVTNTGPITLTNNGTGALSISLDSSWSLVAAIGESKPTLGSASDPNMELDIQAVSTGSSNTLTVILSDNNFGPTYGSQNAVAQMFGQAIGTAGSPVIFNTYYDANDELDGLGTLLTSSGSLNSGANGAYGTTVTNSLSQSGPYSLTEVVSIDGTQASTYSLLANVTATNECNCSLTFTSCIPTNLSVSSTCQIPSPALENCLVKASDTCLGNVPVFVLSAVTNQICSTNGFCYITNGYCFHTDGSCFPTNFISCPTNGFCFLTNGICCPVIGKCSASGCGGCQNFGNCCDSLANCLKNFGNGPQDCYQNLENCCQSFGLCDQNFGNCCRNCGICAPGTGMCCSTLITYTFGATNGCGQLKTFTQTVTLQCQPFFNITCPQPPTICFPQPPTCNQPPQNCNQPPTCNQSPQTCLAQLHNCFPQLPNCFGQQGQNCH